MKYVELVLAFIGGVTSLVLVALIVMMVIPRLKEYVYFLGRFSCQGESLVFPAVLHIFRLRLLMFGSMGYNGVQWREAGPDPPVYRTLGRMI